MRMSGAMQRLVAVVFVAACFAMGGQATLVTPAKARQAAQVWMGRGSIVTPGDDSAEPYLACGPARDFCGQLWTLTDAACGRGAAYSRYSPSQDPAGDSSPVVGGLPGYCVNAASASSTSTILADYAPGVASPGGTYGYGKMLAALSQSSPAVEGRGGPTVSPASSRTLTEAPPLSVVSGSPSGTAGDNSAITVTFSNPMDEAATEAAFSISPSVAGAFSWSADGETLTFTPSAYLEHETQYQVAVSTAAKDAEGQTLASAYSWSFTTLGPPSILIMFPDFMSTDVPVSAHVEVYFTNPMNETATEEAFSMSPAVAGHFSWSVNSANGGTMTFTPSAPLAASTVYIATVSAAAEDIYGQTLRYDDSISFTTAPTQTIASSSPTGTGVAVSSPISVIFGKDMNWPVTERAFSMDPSVAGVFSFCSEWKTGTRTMTFTPSAPLDPGTKYTVTISTAAEDGRGQRLDTPYSWSFTTNSHTTVVSNSPSGTTVSVDAPIVLEFSAFVNRPATEAAFSISPSVAGSFSWSTLLAPAEHDALTFTPKAPLEPSTKYTVALSAAAKDNLGQPLLPASWSFTTATTAKAAQGTAVTMSLAAGLQIVGVPATPANPKADQVLGTTAAMAWDAAAQAYQAFADKPFELSPGMGCWVAGAKPTTISFAGSLVAGPVTRAVYPGWNLLANPSAKPLDWSAVTADGKVSPVGWKWDSASGSYVLVSLDPGVFGGASVVGPCEGFWLLALDRCEVTLGSSSSAAATKPAAELPVAWAIRLKAAAGTAVAPGQILGMMQTRTAVTAGEPPAPGAGYVDLYTVGPQGERQAVDLVAAGAKASWDVVAQTDLPNTAVTITFPDLSAVPKDMSVTLRDLDAGRTVNMRTTSSYSFTSGARGAQRHLRVEAKPQGAQTAVLTSVSAQNVAGGVQVSYTLSAPADVELQVRNIAGRAVASIAGGYCEAGTHTALWSGRNLSGSKVPAGTYLLEVTSKADDGTASNSLLSMQIR